MKKIITIGISLIVLVLAIFVSVSVLKEKPNPRKSKDQTSKISVKVSEVKESKSKTGVTYSGRVNSFDNIILSAEVSGKILQGDVPLKEGESFNEGQLLLKIYSENIESTLKASKSSFLKTLSDVLPDIYIDYPDSYNKWKNFFNSIELDKKLPELPKIDSENEKIFMVSNDIISNYYSIQNEEITLTKYKIWAPFNGYFKSVSKEVGSFTSTGAQIGELIRYDKLEIIVPVYIDDARKIKDGDKVTMFIDDKELTGTVTRIAGFVDEETRSVNIYVTFTQNKKTLFAGEYVQVKFNTTNQTEGITLPREAVMTDHTVYTLIDNKLHKTEINELQFLDDSTLVSGLNTGDIVVVESLLNVKEGQEVNPLMK